MQPLELQVGGQRKTRAIEMTSSMVAEVRSGYTLETMQPLKAQVHKGRLVLDEPTDLPEGEVVYLHPADVVVGDDDNLDDEEREALHRALDQSIDEARAGQHADAEEFARSLLTRK